MSQSADDARHGRTRFNGQTSARPVQEALDPDQKKACVLSLQSSRFLPA